MDNMYSKLNKESGEFRLLTLWPGQAGDRLICSLSIESLKTGQCPPYETISYHWGGNPSGQRRDSVQQGDVQQDYSTILVLEKEFGVPSRATQALECMRLSEKRRTLWIDSICINQNDEEERQQQISVMGDIYKRGTQNLVHLGASYEEEAFRGVQSLRSAYQRLQIELGLLPYEVQLRWKEYRIKPEGWGKVESPPILLDDPLPLKQMFKCAWFTPLWIVQETCLASRNICHWANQKFDLQHLMDVVHISRELEIASDVGDPLMFKSYCCIQQLRYPLLLGQQFRTETTENLREALMMLIDMSRHCDVKYGHDRIFAIVGLLRSMRSNGQQAMKLLVADYQRLRSDVFRDATRAILLLSGTDDLLTKVSHRSNSELLNASKPSWSFYWGRPQDLVHEAGRTTLCTDYHSGTPNKDSQQNVSLAMAEASLEPNILSLRGFLLGPIELVRPLIHGIFDSDYTTTKDLIESITRLTRAELRPEHSQTFTAATLGDSPTRRMESEAFRLRELERAHEVVRRRLCRKVGDMQIKAYSETGHEFLARSSLAGGSADRPEASTQTQEDYTDWMAITIFTAGWCVAHFPDKHKGVRAFRDLQAHIQQSGELPNILSDAFLIHLMICTCSNNRSFFTTSFGNVGCGPKIAESGDVVAVFRGAKHPYILRRASDQKTCYRLVGMAVIPAIMHGEVFGKGIEEKEIRLC